jgi:hypothetical protein
MKADKLLPWSGVAAFVLILASFPVGGSTPKADAPVSDVVAFYTKNTGTQTASSVLMGLGAVFLLIFAAMLASELRRRDERASVSAALLLLGAGILVVSLAVFAGFGLAIADLVGHIDDAAINVLNVLSQEAAFVFVVTIGTSAFMFGAGSGVLTTSIVPRWLGWVAIVLGVIAAIPSHVLGGLLDHIGFIGFAGLILWCAIVGIMLATRSKMSAAPATATSS